MFKGLCCLPILCFYAWSRLFFPCLGAFFGRIFGFLCCSCGCCHYRDPHFPPSEASIGAFRGTEARTRPPVVWKPSLEFFASARPHLEDAEAPAPPPRRPGSVAAGAPARGGGGGAAAEAATPALFHGRIEPADVAQGQVGNCWLMSAFACLAEHPASIARLFPASTYSYRGKYTVRIFDGRARRWQSVDVDDHFPQYVTGQPLFSRPRHNELWVLVYEKAFAKFCGSYGALEGGNALWAFEAMTGDHVFTVQRKGGRWQRYNMEHAAGAVRSVGLRQAADAPLSDDDFFALLCRYDRSGAILAASSRAGSDAESVEGIVQGHAYTVLRVVELSEGPKLIQLRNPWGSFEWQGEWSDKSPVWDAHPAAKRALWSQVDDGAFWMELKDFVRHFSAVDFCDRSSGLGDIVLDHHEACGCCGSCAGCVCGCLAFWCGFRGCRKMCCGHTSTTETRQASCCERSCRCCYTL